MPPKHKKNEKCNGRCDCFGKYYKYDDQMGVYYRIQPNAYGGESKEISREVSKYLAYNPWQEKQFPTPNYEW